MCIKISEKEPDKYLSHYDNYQILVDCNKLLGLFYLGIILCTRMYSGMQSGCLMLRHH